MLLLSTSSLLWGYGLHRIFEFTKEQGYDGIDLTLTFDTYESWDAEYVGKLSEMVQLPVISITAPERKMNKDTVKKVMKLADTLRVKIVNFYPPHRLDPHKDWFWEFLSDVQKRYTDISVSVINAPPKTFFFIIPEYGNARPEVTKKITGHSSLMVAHIDIDSGIDLLKTFTLLGNTIGLIYLSDTYEWETGLFPWEGDMPLESLLIRLRELHYTWHCTLRVNPKALWAGDTERVQETLREAKQYYEKYFLERE